MAYPGVDHAWPRSFRISNAWRRKASRSVCHSLYPFDWNDHVSFWICYFLCIIWMYLSIKDVQNEVLNLPQGGNKWPVSGKEWKIAKLPKIYSRKCKPLEKYHKKSRPWEKIRNDNRRTGTNFSCKSQRVRGQIVRLKIDSCIAYYNKNRLWTLYGHQSNSEKTSASVDLSAPPSSSPHSFHPPTLTMEKAFQGFLNICSFSKISQLKLKW